jgi:hypothetical protein
LNVPDAADLRHARDGKVSGSEARTMTIRKFQFWLEALLVTMLFLLFMLYGTLSIRALFFPGHCAALAGFWVCLGS